MRTRSFRLLKSILSLVVLSFSVCAFQACGGDTDDIVPDATDDYGKITNNSLVATGGYRDVKPLSATILASINTAYQGAYTSMGVEFTPNQANFNSSETTRIDSKSGVSNGHFETTLSLWGVDEGVLKPGTTYYYRAYVYMAGTRYNGEVRSFVTPDVQVSKGDFVDLGVSVKWASCNMGANAPEAMGTLLEQRYAFKLFDYDKPDHPMDAGTGESRYFLPKDVDSENWLGNSSYDVVTRTMGNAYRMPTEDEWQELEDYCVWTSGVCNGVKGFYVCDKKDGTSAIFLPYVKKNTQHDITVYLSAPNDIIWNLEQARKRETQYFLDITGRMTEEEFLRLEEEFWRDMFNEIDKEISAGNGEILTENSHIYNDYGLLLNPFDTKDYIGNTIRYDEYTWAHPETGKEYNFSNCEVIGGGVLYARPVSNR